MNQSAKRILSFVLCLAMLVGMFPAFAFGASAAGTVLDAAIFCSDVHGSTSDLTSVLSGVKTSGVDYSSIGFVGDTCLTVANTTSTVQSALGDTDIDVMFSYAESHDTENSADISTNWNYSGEVAGVSDYYLVYTIRETDMQNSSDANTAAPAFTTWYNGLTEAQKKLPIFIMSHRPLHARRNDNAGAATWYNAISAAAESSDIVFFWAHNHTDENNVDIAAYYVAKDGDETFTVYNGDTVTPNFTYMNAGYINANNQNPGRINVATTVQITADSLIFQDYTTSGEYTDSSYSHNVTVTREFAGSTDTTEPTTEATTETTEETTEAATEATTEPTSGQTSAVTGVESDATVLGSTTTVTEDKTVYVKVDAPVDGEQYLIVSTGTAGTAGYVLGGSSVTPVSGTLTIDGTDATYTYIESTGTLWTASGSGSSWTFANGGNYLGYTQSSSGNAYVDGLTYSYAVNTAASTTTWTLSDSQLYIYLQASTAGSIYGGSDSSANYYLTGGNSWSMNQSAANVYFYKEVVATETITTTIPATTYHMDLTVDGNTVSNYAYTVAGVADGTTAQIGETFTAAANGSTTSTTAPDGGSYTFSSSNEAVATIDADGVLTFTGTEGETLIQVEYTWTENGETYKTQNYVVITAQAPVYDLTASCETSQIKIGATTTVTASVTKDDAPYSATDITFTSSDETIATVDASTGVITGVKAGDVTITASYTDPNGTVHTDTVAVEVVDAVYALDICKKTTDADGNETYESITAPIVIKGVTKGMTHSVWAVITADGEDLGTLTEEQLANLTFTSSDETIATVDKTTGTVTFTGGEGTVNITASYEYADGKFVTDTVTFSVTASNYSIPSDGTSDFPEYPNEGAIRYDKTATAVGNFSQTGIAQVELSMTGVPYTTGSEIDVVVMLDMTGSMSDNGMTAAEEATVAFVEKIVKNEDGTYNNNRVAVYAFNSGSSSPYELVSLGAISSDDALTTANTAIRTASDKQATGGTPFDEATKQCYDVLKAAKTDGIGNDRQQFCVFMSDGGPTTYYGSDEKTYYGGNNNSGDVLLTSCMTGYTSSTSSDWSFTLPTEYYTDAMKADGVIVYTVGLLLQTAPSNPAPYSSMTDSTYDSTTDSLTTIGSHYYFTSSILKQMASDESKYIDIFNVDNASKATAAFESIAKSIMQAATDVTVEDKINDEYTMVFGIPTNVYDDHNNEVAYALSGQEFYIEFVEYTLDENNERTSTYTTLTKLYLKDSNGTGTAGGTYSAASDASGTAYATPVFENKTLGDKGTLYYWTTDSSKSTSGISCTVSGTTYYFVPYGIKATDDGYDSTKWFNMTSGGYASGNIDETTNLSTDLVIATPYFVYNAETRMLYWTVEKLDTSEYALRYFLYLDNSSTDVGETTETAAGPYPTNDYAYITYTNFNKNDCRQEFPIPQMTWNGATVSYVFYLVNEAGQPINKSGQVVDFANATFITDVFQHTVVWNGDNAVEELNIEYLADELLPDAYIVYDEKAEYTIHVYQDESGNSVFDYFIIEGSTEGDVNATNGNTVNSDDTTKVYNTKAGTKYSEYGTYSAEAVGTNFETTDAAGNAVTITTTHQASLDYSDTTVAFAVLWKPRLVEDTVVVDYGLDVLINVVENDILQNIVSGIGLGNEAFGTTEMNTGVYNQGATSGKLGTVPLTTDDGSTISLENENAIRFSQNDMTFAEPVTFYYESPVEFYEGSNKQTGYLYSSVTVIPATTIYYEDEYVTLKTFTSTGTTDADGNTIYTETDGWTTNSVAATATQDQDRPGKSQISADIDADNLYGSDSAYEDQSLYSMGSAAKVNVKSGVYATASFEFYGTGFDIISLTDTTTGVIVCKVYDEDGNQVVSETVNNYYGYAREYYAVTYTYDADTQTWSAAETKVDALGESGTAPENPEDGATYTVYETRWNATAANNPNALYQVPVLKIGDGDTTDVLPYGKYSVVITATYMSFMDKNAEAEGYDFYLDAIRIYNPTGNLSTVANNAYIGDGEGWPAYYELRNQVIDKATFDSLNDETISGIVFIDGANASGAGDAASVADYVSYGPNNELYLESGNAVAFDLNATATAGAVDKIQLAIKTVGGTGSVQVYSVDSEATTATCLDQEIKTATDLYFDITDMNGKTVVIRNTGAADDAIISITNVKITYTAEQTTTETETETTSNDSGVSVASVEETTEETAVTESVATFSVSRSTASYALMSMSADEEVEEETTEPETEATEPETTEPETAATEPETTEPETEDSGSDSTISDIIKKLFGWLFG